MGSTPGNAKPTRGRMSAGLNKVKPRQADKKAPTKATTPGKATIADYGGSSGKGQRLANVRPRNVTLSKQTGNVKTKGGNYPVYKKNSSAAKTFRASFKDARSKGLSMFKFQGRKYNTKLKK